MKVGNIEFMDVKYWPGEVEENILEGIRLTGYNSMTEFVKTNLHYLSKDDKKLFYSIDNIEKSLFK